MSRTAPHPSHAVGSCIIVSSRSSSSNNHLSTFLASTIARRRRWARRTILGATGANSSHCLENDTPPHVVTTPYLRTKKMDNTEFLSHDLRHHSPMPKPRLERKTHTSKTSSTRNLTTPHMRTMDYLSPMTSGAMQQHAAHRDALVQLYATVDPSKVAKVTSVKAV